MNRGVWTNHASPVLLISYNCHLSLVRREFTNINEQGTHGPFIRFHLFGCYYFIYNVTRNNIWCCFLGSGSGNACKKFFLSLQCLVSLPLAQLLESVSYHD